MEPINIPVLALRGLTVFPHMSLTFDVERQISIRALERAMEGDQAVFLVTQREIGSNIPGEKDLYEVGTISHITQILRLSSNAVRVMVEGRRRARLRRLWQTEPFLQANIEELTETAVSEAFQRSPRTEALLRQTWNLFGEYAGLVGGMAEEVVTTVMDCQDVGYLADFIAQNINLRFADKQEILEELSPFLRLRKLNGFLARECNVLGFEHEMEGKVRDQLARTQRDQILRTQIRVLQNELGEEEDDELDVYREKILELHLDEERETHLMKEVTKLSKQPYSSAEAAVIRNYLDVCLDIPWNTTTRERVSVDAARKVLVYVLDKALKLLHPFMPFITEEIYQALPGSAETIMNEKWPGDENMKVWAEDCADFEKLMDYIKAVRAMRAEMNVHPAKKTSMVIETASPAAFEKGGAYLARFAFATDVTVTAKYEGSTDGMVNVATPDAKGFIPMMELIDRDKELARLNKELTKAEKELGMFTNQLNNPKFVEKAPAKLVEETRAKLAAAQDKAAKIKESIAALG